MQPEALNAPGLASPPDPSQDQPGTPLPQYIALLLHTASILLGSGLLPYPLASYAFVRPRVVQLLGGVVVLLSIWMVTVSVTLTWHWFADLWAGLLIGGMTLALTSGVDHAIPRDIFAQGIGSGLRRIPALVLGTRDISPRWRRTPGSGDAE